MKKFYVLSTLLILLVLSSCGGSDQTIPSESDAKKSESNAINKSLPSVIVVPSDALLKRMGCLNSKESQGTTYQERDYNKAFTDNSDLRFAIAEIEGQFSKKGFKLENLEQTMKQIGNNNAMDEMEGVARDLRAELMNTARPDYIIELDYELKRDSKARKVRNGLTYIVKCLDVYTNKTVASISRSNIGVESESNDVAGLIKEDFPNSFEELSSGITEHFKDLLGNGIEITLRVATLSTSTIALDDDCGDEEIGEKIIEWLKKNTVNSTYKMSKNTSTEIYFTNVRIKTKDEDGASYTAYDFAKDLKKALKKGCGLEISNKTQSLGDAFLQID
jgi:hypothetical protein